MQTRKGHHFLLQDDGKVKDDLRWLDQIVWELLVVPIKTRKSSNSRQFKDSPSTPFYKKSIKRREKAPTRIPEHLQQALVEALHEN